MPEDLRNMVYDVTSYNENYPLVVSIVMTGALFYFKKKQLKDIFYKNLMESAKPDLEMIKKYKSLAIEEKKMIKKKYGYYTQSLEGHSFMKVDSTEKETTFEE